MSLGLTTRWSASANILLEQIELSYPAHPRAADTCQSCLCPVVSTARVVGRPWTALLWGSAFVHRWSLAFLAFPAPGNINTREKSVTECSRSVGSWSSTFLVLRSRRGVLHQFWPLTFSFIYLLFIWPCSWKTTALPTGLFSLQQAVLFKCPRNYFLQITVINTYTYYVIQKQNIFLKYVIMW